MKQLAMVLILCSSLAGNLFAQVTSSGKVTIHVNNIAPPVPVIGQQGVYYALIIGVNNYTESSIGKHRTSAEDANLFYKLITTRYVFDKDNVSFLKDATLAEIKSWFDLYSTKISLNDNLLIFFSGQSYWDVNSKTGFWLPSDAKGIGFWLIPGDEDECYKLSWLSNNLLGSYIQNVKTKHILLITDACFAGEIFNRRNISDSTMKPIDLLNELPGKKAITSGLVTNEIVSDVFIKSLNSCLENNNEKYLPSEKLFVSFSKSLSNNIRIVPQFGEINNTGDEGGDFIFILRD